MGKKMNKAEVIFPLNDKKVAPAAFVWMHAEKAILEKIGDDNASSIQKKGALEAVLKAREDKELKEAYIKVGPLEGAEHLYLRIKAKRLFKDYEDDYVLVKDYRQMIVKRAEGQKQLQEFIAKEQAPMMDVDTSSISKNFKALEEHTKGREEGLRLVKKFLEDFKPYVKQMQELREGGRGTLEKSRLLAQTVTQKETEFANGDFIKGRGALDRRIDSALDQVPELKSEVKSLRKRAAVAFDGGMRVMAEIRDIRDQVLSEQQEHELEMELAGAEFLKSDELRLKQLEVLKVQVGALVNHGTVTKLKSWSMIERLTEAGIPAMRNTGDDKGYLGYKAKRDECAEAFQFAATLLPRVATLQKRIALLMKGDPTPGPKAAKAIQEEFSRLSPVSGILKDAPSERVKFEEMVRICDKKWGSLVEED
ncbi:hypothetical protein JI742_13655 [Piscinibacter sp. Jin2]|uniref:Uncharacterized protein n=1 Tax=Aquariibacter lacus TaxID=2801332 RepID=A0A9X1BSF4_9BURK|nr:hypothetical protein [Piscinibacter lacus]MBL0720934.1 hypothetical protein [Piscinibacter lacus]